MNILIQVDEFLRHIEQKKPNIEEYIIYYILIRSGPGKTKVTEIRKFPIRVRGNWLERDGKSW